jgi:hypothetical protein
MQLMWTGDAEYAIDYMLENPDALKESLEHSNRNLHIAVELIRGQTLNSI